MNQSTRVLYLCLFLSLPIPEIFAENLLMSEFSDFLSGKSLLTRDYDYLGTPFPVSFTEDGWGCATDVAKYYGKDVYEWKRSKSTQVYFSALIRREESKLLRLASGVVPTLSESDFVRSFVIGGGGGRTFIHPKLFVHFTRWVDVDFSLWADEVIVDFLSKGGSFSLDAYFNGIIPLLRLSSTHRERFLYVMRETLTGIFKFGLSVSPSRRLYEFHVGNHVPLELVAIYRVKDKGKEELSLLRSYFQNYKVPGSVDWYDLDSFFNYGKEPSLTTLADLVVSLSYSDKFFTDSILSLPSVPRVLSLTSAFPQESDSNVVPFTKLA